MLEKVNGEIITNPQLFRNIDLFLRYPVVTKFYKPQFDKYRAQILKDFHGLINQQDLSRQFGDFFFDPGINSEIRLSDQVAKRINDADPAFYMSYRNSKRILTRRSMLRIASSEIINNKNVAFINFDLKNLRLADQIGYGDILLNDFAVILEKTRTKHHEFNLIPGRVGGDEFCMFVSSSLKIDKIKLQKIYQEVSEELSKITGYYKKISGDEIEKKSPELKTPGKIEDQILVANDERSRRIFLSRSLVRGRIPNNEQFKNAKNVSKEEFGYAKSESTQKFYLTINTDPIAFRKDIEGFSNKHPEFFEEVKILKDLIDKNKIYLSNYLLGVLKDSLKDPLINDEIYSFPGLIRHLKVKSPRQDEKIVHFYMPWLKVLNSDIGYNNTDDVIEESYNDIIGKLEKDGYERKNMIVARRGGDFIFIVKKYQTGKMNLNCERSFPEGHIFKDGMPVFLSTVPFPEKGESIGTYIFNAERESKTSFINWLNQEYSINPTKAIQYVDNYLKERTLDRAKDLLEQFGYVRKPSRGLRQYIISVVDKL